MVNPAETKANKDMAWYSKLGAAVKERVQGPAGKEDQWPEHGRVHPEFMGNVPDEPRQWRGFAFAEAMEQGVAPGLASTFVEAPAQSAAKEQRLVVKRSQNRREYTLQDDAGRAHLLARASVDGLRFDLFAAREGGLDNTKPGEGPAFVMLASSTARDNWALSCPRCERCEARGKRQCGSTELMRLCHYIESVGEGQAFCMDVDLPAAGEDGERAVLCECCGDPSAQWAMELTARRPKWNPKHKSLTLDFNGRCTLASAKNFQLEDPSQPGKVKLLFGKIGEHSFTLDYRYPLGMVQAFAAVLSASHWK